MSQTTINQRIKILIESLRMNPRSFSLKYNVSEGTTRNYLDRGSIPNAEYIATLIRSIDKLNPAWILLGEGTMFSDQVAEPNVTYQKNKGTNNVGNIATNNGVNHVEFNTFDECKKALAIAHEKIAQQASQLQDKERIIRLLELQLNNFNKP